MRLDAPGLGNSAVTLERLTAVQRGLLAESGAIESMWSSMPVIATGTNFETYYDHILAEAARGRMIPFAVTRVSDGAFAGVSAFLDVSLTHRRLAVGYTWHPPAMRGGVVGPATALALIERAQACRIRRIEFVIAEDNAVAIAAVERFGAVREGLLRNYMRIANGSWANMVILALLDTEINAAITLLRDRVSKLLIA